MTRIDNGRVPEIRNNNVPQQEEEEKEVEKEEKEQQEKKFELPEIPQELMDKIMEDMRRNGNYYMI